MGSAFSSAIDRSKCIHKTAFELWSVTALAAAACRAASFCGGSAAQVANDGSATARAMAGEPSPHHRAHSASSRGSEGSDGLRELRITRIQFHDIFVDFSYILPVLATATLKAAELAAAQRAAERADKAKKPGAHGGKAKAEAEAAAAAAAAAKETAEQIAEVTGAFKGLRDDVFNTFLSRDPVARAGRGGRERDRDDPYANDPALQRVRAVDVFAALAVMCKGTTGGKAALLYHLFSDDYDWDLATVGSEPWLLAAHPADCVDSIRVSLQVRQLQVSTWCRHFPPPPPSRIRIHALTGKAAGTRGEGAVMDCVTASHRTHHSPHGTGAGFAGDRHHVPAHVRRGGERRTTGRP